METDGPVEALPIMEQPENDSVTFESAVKIILQWDSTALRGVMLFDDGDGNEIDQYLEAVDEIQRSMELMAISESHDEDLSKGKGATQIAMARLEVEFVNILTCPTSPSYSTSSSSLTDSSWHDEDYLDSINPPSREAIYHLRSIAERMNSVGHLRNCVQLYIKERKALMEVRFRPLGIEQMSSSGNVGRLETEELEAKIKRWVRAARVCVRVLFANEKQLCEQIFQGFGIAIDDDDACFMEVVRDAAIQLFHFAEAVSSCHRSLERLFNILKLYRTLSDLLPDVEALFQSKSSEAIRTQAAEILGRLSEAAREILWKFEDAVLGELSEDPAPGGTIQSLTVSVMKYIIRTSVYERTLDGLIVSNPSLMDLRYSNHILSIPDMKFIEIGVLKKGAALHLIRIVVILQFKLEEKSKRYKDAALAQLFKMNNFHYIVQKIEGCPKLKKMMIGGGDYLKQLTGIFVQAAIVYQRLTWASVLSCLRDEGLSPYYISWVALRERIKSFNALFKKVHRTQTAWSVPDLQLREELRILISLKLIPCYRSFMGRYCNAIPSRYVKYTPEDLETALLDFFEGNPVTQPLRNRSHFKNSY